LHSKSAMPIFMKVVCLAKLHIFPIGWFLSVNFWRTCQSSRSKSAHFSHRVFLKCLVNFWRMCQSSRMTQRGQRETRVFGKGFDHGLT
jgi:hypothetical protein